MTPRLSRWLAFIRRCFRRGELIVRLLGMPRAETKGTEPGLVLIQIDGLGEEQLLRALAAGRMPTLDRLLQVESYRLQTLYSGLPSSTPSVQGELFYGVRSIVPAFSFRDPATGRVVSMLDAKAAERIEKRLSSRAEGLLQGGSAYADVLTGGAKEPHYCSASIGWGEALRITNPFRLLAAALLHAASFLRVATLMLIELILATLDFVRGSLQGRSFWNELACIPLRVGVTVLLRELCVAGVVADVARGLPIIHMNLLGYDEQAHRRGPSSAFAHWSLRGIDRAIGRVWDAAHHSTRRHYEVWVYSDHGQEASIPYSRHQGRSLPQTVQELLGGDASNRGSAAPSESRADWLGYRRKSGEADPNTAVDSGVVQVAANGPIGLIYLNQPSTVESRMILAEQLVDQAGCPAVMIRDEEHRVRGRTRHGWMGLPEQVEQFLGVSPAYLQELADDLVTLATHPLAGDLVVLGWASEGGAFSFAEQNGSHAGPGPHETSGFALLPSGVLPNKGSRDYLRANDLREAALSWLDRKPAVGRDARRREDLGSLRMLSYNVHSCLGMDGRLSPERIARVIARSEADVVCLQELDVGRGRSGYCDQALEVARLLEMDWHFHPAWALEEEQYGDAVLSRLPMRLVRSAALPGPIPIGGEPRGAIWVEIQVGSEKLQVINTHLGLRRREQIAQVEALLGEDWLAGALESGPTVLCGDFNFTQRSALYRSLDCRLRDGYKDVDGPRPLATFSSWAPLLRIDHLFVSPRCKVVSLGPIKTTLTRSASDHLPLLAELRVSDVSDPRANHPATHWPSKDSHIADSVTVDPAF